MTNIPQVFCQKYGRMIASQLFGISESRLFRMGYLTVNQAFSSREMMVTGRRMQSCACANDFAVFHESIFPTVHSCDIGMSIRWATALIWRLFYDGIAADLSR